jgi:hypothetical protein
MALLAGVSSDFLFKKRKFTSLFAINLFLLFAEIPLFSLGFFDPRSKTSEATKLEMFYLGALTDGYYFMFYMLGALSIA